MSMNIFVNLAVKDLRRTKDFFTQLGFSFNPQFTDENAAGMIIGEGSSIMLLTEPFFKNFTPKDLVDPTKSTEVLVALSVDTREMVNEIVNRALALGATETRDPQEHGFMFGRSFNDLDGHIWEIFSMDSAGMNQGTP